MINFASPRITPELRESIENIKGILFDIDGTLVESDLSFIAEYGHEIFVQTCKSHAKHVLDREVIETLLCNATIPLEAFQKIARQSHGLTKLFDSDPICIRDFWLDLNWAYPERESIVIPGCVEALESLKSRDIKIGLITARPQWSKLFDQIDAMGFKGLYDTVSGNTDSSTSPIAKHARLSAASSELWIEPKHLALVGDALEDVHSAHQAKMLGFAVNTGLYDWKDPQHKNTFRPEIISSNVPELVKFLIGIYDYARERSMIDLSMPLLGLGEKDLLEEVV